MGKIVASSFYNALINSEEAISVSTMLEIERIRKQGHLFVTITNRLYTDVLSYNRDFPFLDYIVALNGTYIYDVNKSKIIESKPLSATTIKKIIKSYPNAKINFYTATETLTSLSTNPIYKVEIEYSKKIDILPLQDLKVNITTLNYNKRRFLEITSATIDNYKALKKIAALEKIEEDNVVVIASTEADLPLIKKIQNCYVVKNAPLVLRKMAAKKTASNDSNGVSQVLKNL